MNGLDVVFLIILGGSIIISFFRGGTKEIFTILAMVLAIVGASRLYEVGAKLISGFITNPNLACTISFVFIFLLICVGINFVGVMFQKLLKVLAMGWFDRVLGVLFGFLRGTLLIALAIIVIAKFPLGGSNKIISTSHFLPYFRAGIMALLAFMPDEFSSVISKLME